jgi:hypothetical protein
MPLNGTKFPICANAAIVSPKGSVQSAASEMIASLFYDHGAIVKAKLKTGPKQ